MKAFPSSTQTKVWEDGMELRDYFAAKAMQGLISDPNCRGDKDTFAKIAYEMADAMMKAREL